MLYDSDPFKGPTAYFKMINAFICRCISGEATGARIPYFLDKFKRIGTEVVKRKATFQVLNLACGPSREIQEFMAKDPLAAQSEFHLIDQDPEAIQFSRKVLGAKKRFFFYNQPIQDFLGEQIQQLPLFDLIYSCGLFDYLDDTIFTVAVSVLYSRLAEKGTLIIGNMHPDDYSKTLKWYLDDWPLIYRTKEELMNFARNLPDPKKVKIESEKTGVNLFLVVQK